MHSLGAVLRGAIPILLNQDPALSGPLDNHATTEGPVGARILRVVRAYDALTMGRAGECLSSPEAIHELRSDRAGKYDAEVLDALECVASRHEELLTV